MKKNFFKKLSFVLALAMIVSVLAPAAGAFAAKAPKLSASTKYLHLVDGKNVYDFNISNKVTGWKYLWSSANEDVAEVNEKNGVTTATGAGKTTVSVVITDKDGEEVDELTATVIVRDNIKELTITGTPAEGKLKVGVSNDFNRSYVTEAGKTKGTSGITRWSVSPEGATISDSGVFVATKAGEYTVTARAFQSKAKYASWLLDATKYASYVTSNEATYKVTVANEISSVAPVTPKSVKVTFASAVATVVKDNFSVVNAATKSRLWIKSVTLSDDKLSATVEFYDAMVNDTVYALTATVDSAAMNGEYRYVKGNPVKIEAPTTQVAKADEAYAVKYTVYDENGLDISADTVVGFESTTTITDGKVTLSNGVLAYVTVVYTNPTTGAQLKSSQIAITGVTATGTGLVAYTVQKNADGVNYDAPTTSIKKPASGSSDVYTVVVRVTDQYGNKSNPANGTGNVTFESLDPSVFVVNETTGIVTPVSVGVGSFRIKYGTISEIRTLEIKAEAVKTSFAPSVTSLRVSDTGYVNGAINSADLTVNYKDQYSDNFATGSTVTMKVLSGDEIATYAQGGADITLDKDATYNVLTNSTITFKAVNGITSDSVVVLQFTSDKGSVIVNVSVFKAANTTTKYEITGIKNLDIQEAYDNDTAWDKEDYKTTLEVYAVNSQGFKVQAVTGTTLTVKKADGTLLQSWTTTSAPVDLDVDATLAGSLNFYKGNVLLEAVKGTSVIANGSFTVTDSGVAPSISLNNNKITSAVSTATLESKIDGLGDYHVTDFKFNRSNTNIADKSSFDGTTSVAILGDVTLYNAYVRLTHSTTGRVWDIYVGTLNASIN